MKSKKLLKFEFISQGSLGAGSGLAESFFEVIATRLGAGALLIAFISSSSYISNLLSPLWARLTERYSVRNLVIFSLIMTSLFLLTGAMVKHPLIFSLVIFFYFVFYGIREVLYPVLVENTYETHVILGHAEAIFNFFILYPLAQRDTSWICWALRLRL
jgi:MFS family permease